MNLKDLEDYLDHRRDTEQQRKSAARTTKGGKAIAMPRLTRKPLDRAAQDHVERNKTDDQ